MTQKSWQSNNWKLFSLNKRKKVKKKKKKKKKKKNNETKRL